MRLNLTYSIVNTRSIVELCETLKPCLASKEVYNPFLPNIPPTPQYIFLLSIIASLKDTVHPWGGTLFKMELGGFSLIFNISVFGQEYIFL